MSVNYSPKPTTIPEEREADSIEPEDEGVWRAFQHEQERCRALFAKLSEIPQWSANGSARWLDSYNEALQVCDGYLAMLCHAWCTPWCGQAQRRHPLLSWPACSSS